MHGYFFALHCCILGRRSMSLWVCSSYHIYSEKRAIPPSKISCLKIGEPPKKTVRSKMSSLVLERSAFPVTKSGKPPRQPTTSSRPGTGHFLPWNLPGGWFVGRELAQWPSIPQEIMMATEVGGWFNSHFLGGDIDPYDSRWGFSQMNPFRKSK